MKKIYLTESAFAKLFYEILLRLEPTTYNFNIYKALENCLLFINSHLNLLKTDSFGNINLIEEKRIIGFEAILNIHIFSEDERVKMNTRKIFQSIISKQIEKTDLIENIVLEEFLSPLLSMIEDLKEKIPIEPQESIKGIKAILKLIEDTQLFMIEKLRRYDMMDSLQIKTTDEEGQVKVVRLNGGNLEKTEEEAQQGAPKRTNILSNFHEEINLKVNNKVRYLLK